MAVKKTKSADIDVQIDEDVVSVDDSATVETAPEDFGAQEEKTEDIGVTVDSTAFNVDEESIPEREKKAKIRMRSDHHCVIAKVRYDLKAGKCYDVPVNVKKILDKAGLLSPLN